MTPPWMRKLVWVSARVVSIAAVNNIKFYYSCHFFSPSHLHEPRNCVTTTTIVFLLFFLDSYFPLPPFLWWPRNETKFMFSISTACSLVAHAQFSLFFLHRESCAEYKQNRKEIFPHINFFSFSCWSFSGIKLKVACQQKFERIFIIKFFIFTFSSVSLLHKWQVDVKTFFFLY